MIGVNIIISGSFPPPLYFYLIVLQPPNHQCYYWKVSLFFLLNYKTVFRLYVIQAENRLKNRAPSFSFETASGFKYEIQFNAYLGIQPSYVLIFKWAVFLFFNRIITFLLLTLIYVAMHLM